MGIPWNASMYDAYRITGLARLSNPRDYINEAADPSQVLSFHLDGMTDEDMLRGGKGLSEFPLTATGDTATNNIPGSVRTFNQPNVLESLEEYWRMTEDAMVFNKITRDMNEGTAAGGGRYEQIKSEQVREEVRVATSLSNKMERDYFAEPNSTTMQGSPSTTIIDPMSLWVGLNEYGGPTTVTGSIFDTDRRYPVSSSLPSGWTTLHGINPSTSKWHRNWTIPYNDVGPTTSTVSPQVHNFLTAMIKAVGKVNFRKQIYKPQFTQTNTAYKSPDYMVPVSTHGDALIKTLCQVGQQYFRLNPQDPYYPNPTFGDIPFVFATGMDTAAVYPTTGTTAPALGAGGTESTAGKKGPRFPLVSKKWVRQFFLAKYFFYMWEPQREARQYDTEILPITCIHQRMFLGRRKTAMIYPVADITGYYDA